MRRYSDSRLGAVAITPPAQVEYFEEFTMLPFDVVLTAAQEKTNQGRLTEGDGDFVLTGLAGTQTGAYQIRIKTPSGRYFPIAYTNNQNIIGTAQFPVPVEPGITFKAGELISLDIKDTSGAGNTVQIVFIGKKLLKVR